MTLPRSLSYTDEEYDALVTLGYDVPCGCFDRTGIWDGHVVNPPCAALLKVREDLANPPDPTWKKGFYNALENYFGLPKDSITSVDESASEAGGCPTCYGGQIDYEVDIYYNGGFKTYQGSLAELMQSL